jgi:hypothetical protein
VSKTNQQIVDDCNKLAQTFYAMCGYEVPDDYKMYEATHPQETSMWTMAVYAYDHIEGTDVECALAEMEGDESDLKEVREHFQKNKPGLDEALKAAGQSEPKSLGKVLEEATKKKLLKTTYTVWNRPKRTSDPAHHEKMDAYEDLETAKEFATANVEDGRAYESYVLGPTGVCVFEARKSGVRPVPKRKK